MNVLPLGKKLTIAIDVDGTVADSSHLDFRKVAKDPRELSKARPIAGALKAVKKLHRQGHTIVFHTSRDHGSRAVTEKWLKKHGFPFHHVETEKFIAHVYIDDRAINGCNWKRALKDLKNPKLPGRRARKQGLV